MQQNMSPIQIVIDTNVLVSAFRSTRGASFALLRRMHDKAFVINLSNALVLEYEEKLQVEAKRHGLGNIALVGKFLDYIVTRGKRWGVHGSLPVSGIDPGDQYIFDLAIASEARIIVSYNVKHFRGAAAWGVAVMRPGEFLRILEESE